MNNKHCFRLAFQFIFTDQIESIEYERSITGIQRFSIDCQELWEVSIATFKKLKFSAAHQPKVQFLEAGIDAGGLSTEYGILLMEGIIFNNGIFV
jgi:hypothetical protein